MKTTTLLFPCTCALLGTLLAGTPAAHADSFGSGANQFDIDFVTIGNPGNAPDDISASPDFAGSVAQTYRIGQFEVSEDMINKANTLGGLGLTHNNRGANKPATSISWFEAAQFVNWLNTDSGSTPAYKFSGSSFELWAQATPATTPTISTATARRSIFCPVSTSGTRRLTTIPIKRVERATTITRPAAMPSLTESILRATRRSTPCFLMEVATQAPTTSPT
jgi:hypothetical protein